MLGHEAQIINLFGGVNLLTIFGNLDHFKHFLNMLKNIDWLQRYQKSPK
jgi:hypothetical protein